MLQMIDQDLNQQRVIIREDLNVPLKDGVIQSDARIMRALPSIKKALAQHAQVLILSHLGRPAEGEYDPEFSLAPVAKALGDALGFEVPLLKDWLSGWEIAPGRCALAENVRFNVGEKADDDSLAKRMAAQCDVFVMDAFATAHRAQASTYGIARFAPLACAGPLLVAELSALSKALTNPQRPVVAIVGGSKVSTKITVLDALLDKVDVLIVGGGIANTFLAAQGYAVGNSLYEEAWVEKATTFLERAKAANVQIPLPVDVAVADSFNQDAKATIKSVDAVSADDMILDVGPETARSYPDLLQSAKTIVWNGPVGVFEFANFSAGTRALGEAIATSDAFSIAGGGDTLAALDQFHIADRISYISTGGGAFLEFLEGKTLPAVAVLEQREYHEAK